MTEDQIRDLLREMRDEPIPPDSKVRVRTALKGRIQAGGWKRLFHRQWGIAAVLFAMASVVTVLMLFNPARRVHEPSPPVGLPESDAQLERASPLERTAAPPISRRTKHPAPRILQPARHAQPSLATDHGVVIRIETSDPNVVILLVGD
jgi:hypothetical protein